MICCDGCEDWFHGSCVGVSKQLGKEIQRTQQQWQCPKCSKGTRSIVTQVQQEYSIDTHSSACTCMYMYNDVHVGVPVQTILF